MNILQFDIYTESRRGRGGRGKRGGKRGRGGRGRGRPSLVRVKEEESFPSEEESTIQGDESGLHGEEWNHPERVEVTITPAVSLI